MKTYKAYQKILNEFCQARKELIDFIKDGIIAAPFIFIERKICGLKFLSIMVCLF